MKTPFRIILILVITVVVVGSFALGYFFRGSRSNGAITQTNSNTNSNILGASGTYFNNAELGISLTIPDGWEVNTIGGAAPGVSINGKPGMQGQRFQLRISQTLVETGRALQTAQGVAETAKDRGASVKTVKIGKDNSYTGYRVDNLFGGDVSIEQTYVNHPKAVLSIERNSRQENENYPNVMQDYDISEVMLRTLAIF